MIEIREAATVNRAAPAVFAHLARVEALPAWLPPVRSAEPLDPGPLRVGSRARLVIDGPGRPIMATGEVTELAEPSTIAFRTLDAPARVRARCVLVPVGTDRTELRLTATIELPGLLRFGEGLARDRIRQELPAALDDLRRRLEDAIPETAAASSGIVPPTL